MLLIVDLVGASPCNCALREAGEHPIVTLSGLNLAILLKLASLDRTELDAVALASELARSGRRSVTIDGEVPEEGAIP